MPDTIPDLWPPDMVGPDILTPRAILGYQASQLRQRSKSILEAEIRSEESSEPEWMLHHFEIIAPVLHRYIYRLFTVRHRNRMVYPVYLSAEWYPRDEKGNEIEHVADGQDAFFKLLSEILRSRETQSVIQSLIAQSNEAKQAPAK